MNDDADIRRATLMAMPEVAQQRSDELFDHLSVLIDDPVDSVRAACDALVDDACVPSGVEDAGQRFALHGCTAGEPPGRPSRHG